MGKRSVHSKSPSKTATSKLPFRVLGDRVVIRADREDRAPQETASGLLTAKSLNAAVEGTDPQDSWFVGTVVGLGPQALSAKDPVYVGDRVTFSWAAGQELRFGEDRYLILHTPEVLAVLPEEGPDAA